MNDRTKNSPRRSNLREGSYRSLRQAYLVLQPDMAYLTFYKRVKSGMSWAEAATTPLRKAGRRRHRKLPWEGA